MSFLQPMNGSAAHSNGHSCHGIGSDRPHGPLKLGTIMQSSFIQSGDLCLLQHTAKPRDMSFASRWFPFVETIYQARGTEKGSLLANPGLVMTTQPGLLVHTALRKSSERLKNIPGLATLDLGTRR